MAERLIFSKNESGFALVEVIVGITIASALLVSFSALSVHARQASRANVHELQAALYLREAVEIAKDIEQSNFYKLAGSPCGTPGSCHPVRNGMEWDVVAGNEILDGLYTRDMVTYPVYRSAAAPHDIVDVPGTLDPNCLKVKANISWAAPTGQRNASLETIIYRIQ